MVDKAISEAELPEMAKTRLSAQFAEATSDDGLEEAITSEKEYVASIKESGKVTGMGKTDPNEESAMQALTESTKRMNPDWSDEKVATFVTGR